MKKTAFYYIVPVILLMLGTIVSAQTPTIRNLSLEATSPDFSTNDDLFVNYNDNHTVETAAAWYVDWVPLALLQLPFEAETTNALLDFSGSNNHLSTSGVASTEPTWGATVGHDGTGAFTFDGNDYLIAGSILPANPSYTKSAWIYITSEFGYRNIISGVINDENNHGFKINPNGRLNAGHSFGAYYVVDSDSLHNNVWYHVAVTFEYSTGEMVLYKDGVEVDRAIVPESNRSVTDSEVLIGSKAYSYFFSGNIDDARLYDRAMSTEQIQNIYNNQGELIDSKETHGGENWRVRVTGFSGDEVGENPITASELIQSASISGLSLAASSPESLTDDDLTASFSSNGSVVESATAWFRDGNPDALLYLPFDGGKFDALLDFSGNDNHLSMAGDIISDPTWDASAGHDGSGSFVFGDDDYLEAGDILPSGSSYTKTAWVYPTALGFNNIMSSVLHDDNNHFFKMNADGRLNAGHSFGADIVIDGTPLSLDTWYFVAVTFDYETGEMILYKDGAEVNTATVPLALRDISDGSVLIGSMNHAYNWDGSIDDARLYDRVLSPQQIIALSAGNNLMVSEETFGGEDWHVEVTPFSSSEAGSTSSSNTLEIHSVVVSDITDQTVIEGSTFNTLDLDDYITLYEFTEGDIDWTATGNSELTVAIDPVTHVLTVTIPDPDWAGSEDITLTATNPNDDSDFTEVAFTVTNVNDAPVLALVGGQITDEDTPLVGLVVEFTDADPTDTHTITLLSSNPNVSVSNLSGDISGSTYDLVPAANWNGSSQITVRVTDNGTGTLSDEEVFTLVVNAVNDAPILTEIGDQSILEDEQLVGLSVVFSDEDDEDQHTITVISDDAGVSVENLTGNINGSLYDLVPAANWNGSAQITVSVIDNGSGALFDTETYTFTVDPLNDAPVLTEIGAQTSIEDMDIMGLLVNFTDPDATDNHTITVVSSDPSVTIGNLSGQTSGSSYNLVLDADWNGTTQITVTVVDDSTVSDFETYSVTVSAVDDAPRLTTVGPLNVDEDDALMGIPIDFVDPDDGDTHTISVISSESNVVVANLSGNTPGSTYALIPVANWNGTAQITVTVTENGSSLFASETYTLTVNPMNDAPTSLTLSDSEVDERVALGTSIGLFTTEDIDVDDVHTYTFVLDGGVNDVDNDAFIIDGDTLKTNAELDFEVKSSYSILVQTDDGQGGTISQNFTITVADLDETSVEDIYNNPSFNVYPVPAIDYLNVEVDNPENKELLLEIYSNNGRLVHAEPIYRKNRVDLTELSDGMYIVKIKGGNIYGTRKIIVKDR